MSERKSILNAEQLYHHFINEKFTHQKTDNKTLNQLIEFGGFPEPFLKKSKYFHQLWQRGRVEKLVREDLRDLSRIQELSQVEMLISLLPESVANLFSLASIREDLEVAHLTLVRWLDYLKELYYFYEIKPYTKSIPRTLKKEGKIFLWDWSEVEKAGPRFENLIASHLYKACHYWTDSGDGTFDLHYLRNKEKNEVDFLITKNNKPWITFEVKSGQTSFQKTILKFSPFTKHKLHFQLTTEKNYYRKFNEGDLIIVIISVDDFLRQLP